MKKLFILFAAATALLASCKKDKDKSGTFKGPEVQVYAGKTWSKTTLDKDGKPTRMSLVLTDAAISSVPLPDQEGADDENMWVVKLHPKAADVTPIKFISLGWNPAGHEPQGIYTVKHFDLHFYQASEDEVMDFVDATKMEIAPAAQYIPANHIAPAPGVPMMGKHWIDVTSPELNGQPFSQTFIWGSYNGKMVFLEPMITQEFLQNNANANFDRPIPQPAKYQTTGYYPTRMKVSKHDGVTEIILDGFVYRQAS